MQDLAPNAEFKSRMQQLETLLQEVETIADPGARARTAEIIQALMEFHGAGIRAIVNRLSSDGHAGRAVIDDLAQDELVGSLLLLYDLHPLDLRARVRLALEKVAPTLANHGGSVELLGISDDGAVRLRLHGSCHGCPSSSATLKGTIEAAICEHAPDVTSIDVEGVETEPEPHARAAAGFVPIEQLLLGGAAMRRAPEGALS